MILGVAFASVAAGFLFAAWSIAGTGAGDSWLRLSAVIVLTWTGFACAAASLAWLWPLGAGSHYRRVRVLFGKRVDGTRTPWSRVAWLPFLGPLGAWWHWRRPRLTESPWSQLLPDLWIGRRLLDEEFELEVDHLVDLTCEYTECPRQRAHPGYLSLPIVDGAAPPPQVLERYLRQIEELPGRVFLHCAEGHGRTATIAAGLLLRRGIAADIDDALVRVQSVRPKAKPYRQQLRSLRALSD
ncbi:MAG: hypothetical protein AAF196_08635 [Planctomycetota bacterium]